MFRIIGVWLVGLLLAGLPKEADAYSLLGSGSVSCDGWTSARSAYGAGQPASPDTQAALQRMQWALGFISGIGLMGSTSGLDPLHGVDAEAVWTWIDNYCRANPLKNINDAAYEFVLAHPR